MITSLTILHQEEVLLLKVVSARFSLASSRLHLGLHTPSGRFQSAANKSPVIARYRRELGAVKKMRKKIRAQFPSARAHRDVAEPRYEA